MKTKFLNLIDLVDPKCNLKVLSIKLIKFDRTKIGSMRFGSPGKVLQVEKGGRIGNMGIGSSQSNVNHSVELEIFP